MMIIKNLISIPPSVARVFSSFGNQNFIIVCFLSNVMEKKIQNVLTEPLDVINISRIASFASECDESNHQLP